MPFVCCKSLKKAVAWHAWQNTSLGFDGVKRKSRGKLSSPAFLKTVIWVWLLSLFEWGSHSLEIIQYISYCSMSHYGTLAGAENQSLRLPDTYYPVITMEQERTQKCTTPASSSHNNHQRGGRNHALKYSSGISSALPQTCIWVSGLKLLLALRIKTEKPPIRFISSDSDLTSRHPLRRQAVAKGRVAGSYRECVNNGSCWKRLAWKLQFQQNWTTFLFLFFLNKVFSSKGFFNLLPAGSRQESDPPTDSSGPRTFYWLILNVTHRRIDPSP